MDHDTDADRPSPALVDEAWKFAMMPFAHTAAVVGWQCGLLSSPWPRPVMTPAALAAEVLTCTPPADPELVLRLLRLLLLYGVFEQVGTDPARFRHTPLSDVLGRPNGSLAIAARACAGAARGATALPDYLAAVGYRSPGDAPSLFQWSRRTDQDLFDFMSKAPDASQKSAPRVSDDKSAPPERAVASGSGIAAVHGFNVAMEAMYRLTAFGPDGRTTALDPWAAEFAAAAAAAGGPFTIVDVGGGTGHVIKALRARLPADVAARGRFVLEDKAESMATLAATPPAGIELQAYNFMTEAQPVQGANAYIFRNILHDWSPAVCRTILRGTVSVLERGVSRILVVEETMPASNAPVWTTFMDINLMSYGGGNRTAEQWAGIAASAGLKVVKTWPMVGLDQMLEMVPVAW